MFRIKVNTFLIAGNVLHVLHVKKVLNALEYNICVKR